MDFSRIDPLISICGEKIKTVHDWETYRREEIMVLLSNFVYGIRPVEQPRDISFRVLNITQDYEDFPLIKKDVEITFHGFSMIFYLFLPKKTYRKMSVPLFLHVLNESSMNKYLPVENPDVGFFPITQIAERGYGCAVMPTLNVSPDWNHRPGYKKGVFRAIQPDVSERNNRSWGNISAWAFGASRIMDYLETDTDVKHTKVAISGHSRAGKAALWAAATDTRFALCISNDSGCGGASYLRGTSEGREHLKNINCSDWFCGNYRKYNDREELLPCDQHMLIAALAPRPVYVKSNADDAWAGPEEELLSCRLASPVYELYGKKGVISEESIIINKPYHDGDIAYHRAPGDHNLEENDWQLFMDFADKYLK